MDVPGMSTDKSRPCTKDRSRSRPLTGQEIAEIVNDSDSDGYELDIYEESEIDNSIVPDEEDDITLPEPQSSRSRKRTRGAATDTELGWNTDIIKTLNKPRFCGFSELNSDFVSPDSSPIDVFNLFFGQEMYEKIQIETNRYATQQINKRQEAGPIGKKSIYSLWKDVSIREIKIFFAIVIHMCLVRKPELRDYWSTTPILQTNYASALGMSRDRFLAILTMLHLNDNESRIPRGQPGYDATHKIKPLLENLRQQFQMVYAPCEEVTIDEAICAFRGRIFFRVYMKGKPHKYGMKIYELCEAQSGFVFNLEIYTGAHETDATYNSPFNVVDRLCQPLKHLWHTVYMDRYFTSPALFDHLWNSQTKAVGTVMSNRREMPKQHFSKKLKKGEKLSAQRDHLLAVKWRDVRDVHILTTANNDTMVELPRTRGDHQKTKPSAVADYNKYKIGVDKSDQMLSYYSFQRKSVKWWKKLFFHLFDLTLVNAHIIHRKKSRPAEKLRLHKFLQRVAEGLVAEVGQELAVESQQNMAGRLVGRDHFMNRIPATNSKQKGWSQRTCKVCADKTKYQTGKAAHKYTTFYCKTCNVGLCLGECFEVYHTKQQYWV